MDGSFDRQVLAKLPLAEAVLIVMRYVFEAADLTALYEANRGRSYTKELGFAALVELLWDGLTGPWKSVRNGLVKADEAGRLPVSFAAFYQKLGGLPIAVTRALFRVCAAKLRELLPVEPVDVPECLRGWTVLAVDGKVIKHVPRRRPELRLDRDNAGKLLGGRALVLRDRWTGVAFDLELDLDGEANEIKHLPRLLASAAPALVRFLMVGDRAFGVFEVCRNIQEHRGDFLLRQHGMTKFVADPDVPERRSTDRFGRVVVERWGWITRGKETLRRPAERIAVRQITVVRDQETLTLITSLLDAEAYPADALLDAYLDRWDIEQMFQVTTEVFGLKQLASTSPAGTLLQLVLCLLAYNVIQLVKLYVARSQNLPEPAVSNELLFRDVAEELIAAARLLPAERLAELMPPRDAEAVRRRLHELLDGRWQTRWKKSNYRPRDPSRPIQPKPERIRQTKSHDSVHRILQRNRQ
jgi:hypothetical protein